MRFLFIVLAGLLLTGVAHAEGIQAQCGAESGRGFAAEGGFVTAADAGWYDDQVRGETVIRIDTNTGEVDVRFRDATGIWQSVTDTGGQAAIFTAQDDPAAFMVTVTYPGTAIEVLTIAEIDNGSAQLIHTLSRVTDRLTNSRVLVADCVLAAF